MKNIGSRKKRDIIIDLTSMLDVIFIILLVVMCNQHVGSVGKEDLPSMDPQIPQSLEERVATATIVIPYDEDVVTRHIEITYNNSEVPKSIEINKENATVESSDNPFELFGGEIESFVVNCKENDIPVILTLDDREMLYRDANKVSDILTELDSRYDNLYCRGLAR